MQHLEHYQFCITVRFCFGTELHLYMYTSAFGMIPWFSAGLTNSTHTIFSRVSNVVNCGYSWYELMRYLRQEELQHLSIHNLTWQESNIGRFVNHNISSKVKLYKSCLKTCNWFVVWLRMTSEFSTKPPSKTWKRLFRISFLPFNPLDPDQHQISPWNSDAL